MERMRALLREPALLIDAFESLVVVLVALGLFGLNGDQQTNLIALFIAVLAFVKGFLTRPFPVTVIPDLGRAAAVFCVSLGLLRWSPDQITLVVTFLGTLMTVVQRSQITPRSDAVSRPGGAGAGPVSTQSGVVQTNLALAVVLIVAGILLLVLMGGTIGTVLGLLCLVAGLIFLFA